MWCSFNDNQQPKKNIYNKIKEKKIRPTGTIFWGHVTLNRHFFWALEEEKPQQLCSFSNVKLSCTSVV